MHWNKLRSAVLPKRICLGVGFCVIWAALGLDWAQVSSAPQSSTNQPATGQQTAPAVSPTPARPVVMLDPAHGGSESGAVLSTIMLEKDVTLAWARRLRQDLSAHGILVQLTRDEDTNLSADDRAAKANRERPSLYICLHASSAIGGLRIFTAMLPLGGDNRGLFTDWETAQSASLANSRALQQQLATILQKNGIPARALAAPLRPLNNVTVPALAIEIAPTTTDVTQLASPDYQQSISAALASAIATVIPSAIPSSSPTGVSH